MLSIISVQEMLLKEIKLPLMKLQVQCMEVYHGLPELSLHLQGSQMIWTYEGEKSGLKRDG